MYKFGKPEKHDAFFGKIAKAAKSFGSVHSKTTGNISPASAMLDELKNLKMSQTVSNGGKNNSGFSSSFEK